MASLGGWVGLASRRFFSLGRLEHVMQALCWSDRKTGLFFSKTNKTKGDGKTGLSKDVFPGLGSVVKVCLRFSFLCEKVKARFMFTLIFFLSFEQKFTLISVAYSTARTWSLLFSVLQLCSC